MRGLQRPRQRPTTAMTVGPRPSEVATAADQLEGSGWAEPPQERFSCERHRWFATLLMRICHVAQTLARLRLTPKFFSCGLQMPNCEHAHGHLSHNSASLTTSTMRTLLSNVEGPPEAPFLMPASDHSNGWSPRIASKTVQASGIWRRAPTPYQLFC